MTRVSEALLIGPVSQNSAGYAQSAIVVVMPATAVASDRSSTEAGAARSLDAFYFAKALLDLVDAAGRAQTTGARTVGASLIDCANTLVVESMEFHRKSIETASLSSLLSLQVKFIERRFEAAYKVASVMLRAA